MEMDPVLHLRYLTWATSEVLTAVKQLPGAEYEKDRHSSYGGIKGTLDHMFRADSIWFSRVSGEPYGNIKDVPVPETLEALEHEWISMLRRMENWFGQLGPNQLGIEIRYSNSQGIPCSTPLWQVVLHVVNHSTMHRGQVVAMMRQASAKPPNTDLITYYRLLQEQATRAR